MSNSDYAIDSNAAIPLMNREPKLISRLARDATLFMPITVLGELYFGAERSTRVTENLARLEAFRQDVQLLGCDVVTAQHYGRIEQSLRAKGKPIPDNDVWIAAACI